MFNGSARTPVAWPTPKIRGARFDRHAYVEAPSSTRDALASSLADTLVGLQDALARRSESAGLTTADFTKFYTPLREHLSDFPPGARPHISDLLDEFAELFLSGTVHDHVAMHNDFHFDNLVLDAPLGRVVGVWDFSCVSTGSPEWDLRYFEADLASPWETPVHARGQHHDLLRRVSREYETLRGLDVNVRASVVANRVEALCDLWVDGAPKAIRGWTEWDAHAR